MLAKREITIEHKQKKYKNSEELKKHLSSVHPNQIPSEVYSKCGVQFKKDIANEICLFANGAQYLRGHDQSISETSLNDSLESQMRRLHGLSANDTFDSLLNFMELSTVRNNSNDFDSDQTFFEVEPYNISLDLPQTNAVEVFSEDERYVAAVFEGNNISEVITSIQSDDNESNITDGSDAAVDGANVAGGGSDAELNSE